MLTFSPQLIYGPVCHFVLMKSDVAMPTVATLVEPSEENVLLIYSWASFWFFSNSSFNFEGKVWYLFWVTARPPHMSGFGIREDLILNSSLSRTSSLNITSHKELSSTPTADGPERSIVASDRRTTDLLSSIKRTTLNIPIHIILTL